MKVLEAIRTLLKVKKVVTVPDIQKYTEYKNSKVIDILVKNFHLLKLSDKGSILKETVALTHRSITWEQGLHYYVSDYGYYSVEGYRILLTGHNGPRKEVNEELVKKLGIDVWMGGMGDCSKIKIIECTKENYQALDDEGLLPWDLYEPTDELWNE